MQTKNRPSSPLPRAGFNSCSERASSDSLALWATPGVGRSALCSPIVGFIAGLGAVAFLLCLQAMYSVVLGGLLHFHMPPTLEGKPHAVTYPWPWWLVLLVPTVGGLISGILVFTWAPEAEGHGTDAMIRAFHQGGGMIRTRVPLIKSVASIITIGTGGSAGQEGPIAQIGSGFGSYLARVLKLPPSERRILMLAGAAAGIGAIFRRRLGALFCRRSSLFLHGPRIGGAASLPGQLDRGLFDVRPVHHPEADLQPAQSVLPGIAGSAFVRGADPALRGLRLALRPRLLRFEGQALQALAHPEAAQTGGGRVLAGPGGPGLPAGDDRRVRLGPVGSDRDAAGADPCRASRASFPTWEWGCS